MATQTATEDKSRFRSHLSVTRLIIYFILLAFAAFYILPIYLIIITSFKQYADVNIYRMWEFPPVIFLDNCTNPAFFCFDS